MAMVMSALCVDRDEWGRYGCHCYELWDAGHIWDFILKGTFDLMLYVGFILATVVVVNIGYSYGHAI